MESQPWGVALGMVRVSFPDWVKVIPWKVKGSWLSQTVALYSPSSMPFTSTFSVTMESQPWGVALGMVRVSLPAASKVTPWKVKGSWLSQTVALYSPSSIPFTVTLSVTMESQPYGVALGMVRVCVPVELKVTPWKVKGIWVSQTVAE